MKLVLDCNERKVLDGFLKQEFQARKVSFSELYEPDYYNWKGEKVEFETSTSSFEIWLESGKAWTVWHKPFGQWYVYSPSAESLPDVFGTQEKLRKMCFILGVSVKKYIEM